MSGRRIALVGTAPSSIHAPFGDESWEIWGTGYRGDHVTRATRWFELHRLDGDQDPQGWRDLYKEWCKETELWMIWPEPELGPKVIAFPWQRLKDRFGTFFFTSSFSWMMALAIDEAPAEIGLWGVDMEYGTEYREQRAGLQHFIGIAKESGIAVTRLLSGGVTYEPIPYPFWMDDPLLQKANHRRETVAEQKRQREFIVAQSVGRLSQIAATVAVLRETQADHPAIAKLDREAEGLRAALPKMQTDAAWSQGVIDDLDWLRDFLKP